MDIKDIKRRIMTNNMRLIELVTIKTYDGSTPEIENEINQINQQLAEDKMFLQKQKG